jgi:hypothetical protein
MILSDTWNSFYFHAGVPVFRYEIKCAATKTVPSFIEEIEKAGSDSIFMPIKVRGLAQNEFAFRELWWGWNMAYYTPVMHGNLKFTSSGNVRVVGLVNWYTVLFGVLVIAWPICLFHDAPYTIAFPFGFFALISLLYFIQQKRFKKIANVAASLSQP